MENKINMTVAGSEKRILIIDDDEGMSYTLARMVEESGFEADMAARLSQGLDMALSGSYDVIFLDVRLPDGNGIEIIPKIRSIEFPPEIIIITAFGEKGGADLALKNGAWDYLQKPADLRTMELSLIRALAYRNQKLNLKKPLQVDRQGILGNSTKLLMCLSLMGHAGKSDANVLITGETGTGKEVFAKAIHLNSGRKACPFITVDCTALPHSLAESILFGHVKGAFTGADKNHDGLIRQADQGTLFLDEVGELPPVLQKKLLRVLQEKKFRPVGDKKEVKSDFRLVSATNRDLEGRVKAGKFRQDLLFRLRTFIIELPPVRERKKDIDILAAHYIQKFCGDYGFESKTMSDDFLNIIHTYAWPGNIREFISAMESAVAVDPASRVLFSKHLPNYIRIKAIAPLIPEKHPELTRLDGGLPITKTLKTFRSAAVAAIDKQYLSLLMGQTKWNIPEACKISGVKRARLYQRLKELGIRKKMRYGLNFKEL